MDLEYTLDKVMDVRDAELERLKDDALMVVAESAQEREVAAGVHRPPGRPGGRPPALGERTDR